MTIGIDYIVNPSAEEIEADPLWKPRKVNLIAIFVVLVCGLVLGVGVYLRYDYQVKRNLQGLLEQADQAEEAGQLARAANHLNHYLSLDPLDNDALIRYALLKHRLAESNSQRRRAYYLLDQAVRRQPQRQAVRREAVRMAVELSRYTDAKAHLKELLQLAPGDGELFRLRARCEAGVRDFDAAGKSYKQALQLDPSQVDWWMEYVSLLRDQPKLADKAVTSMLAANERALPARLAAARYFLRVGARDLAEEQVNFGLEQLKARDAETLMLAAEVATGRGMEDQARKHLELGVQLHPRDETLLWELARLELRAGRRDRSLELVRGSLQKLPTSTDKLWDLGNLLFDLGETDRIEEVCQRLTTGRAYWAVAVLRARASIRDEAWGDAAAALEKVRALLPSPQVVCFVNLILASCYHQLGNPDRQLRACEHALEGDPSSVAARRLYASALVATGRKMEAVTAYRRLAVHDPGAGLELARQLIGRNLRLPENQRDWAEVEKLLQSLPKGVPGSEEAWLLRAEMLAGRGELDRARELAEAQRKLDPKQVAPWLALVRLDERQRRPASVLPLLDQAERQAGRRVEWELARAHHWAGIGMPEAAAHLRKLEESVKDFPKTEQSRLLLGLARAQALAGDPTSGRRLWRLAARQEPNNLDVRFLLFELAFQAGELDEARGLARELRRLEGEGGPMGSWCAAALLAQAAQKGDKKALAQARLLLNKVAAARPTWSFVPSLEGWMYELEGLPAKALERYKIAIHQGEARSTVVYRALQLHYQQGLYAEAANLLRSLPEEALSLPGVGRLAAEISLRGASDAAGGKRAVALARRAVPADSKDHLAHLWLGHLAALAGQPAEAELAFRRARSLADSAPETWAALILFLARVDAKKAEAELQAAKGKLSPENLGRILGPANEALGRLDQAEKAYQAAAGGSKTPAVLQSMAGFYARQGQNDQAEACLRQLIEDKTKASKETAAQARRALAVLLASTGNYRRFREAEGLLAQNAATGQEGLEDRRARALVLATRPEHRQAAIRLVEGLSSRSAPLSPESKWLLAQLYEADGRWPQAETLLRELLAQNEKNPVYAAYYVRALLRHDKIEDASAWVDKLAALAPNAFTTAELQSRVLRVKKETGKAAKALMEYAKRQNAPLDRVAALLDELGLPAEAESVYKAHGQRSKDPHAPLLLARHLAQRNRVTEALQICEEMWAKGPPELVAHTSLSVVQLGKSTEEQRDRVRRWVGDAGQKHPKSLLLRILKADCSNMVGARDDAITLYRDILKQSPGNLLAGNNLAFLLAFKEGEQAEALKVIQRTLDEVGPNPELLDTRAVIHLLAGNENLALRDLEQAVVQNPSAVKYFHLAQSHLKKDNKVAAATAYKRAVDLGLKEADLHPLERPSLRQLLTDLRLD